MIWSNSTADIIVVCIVTIVLFYFTTNACFFLENLSLWFVFNHIKRQIFFYLTFFHAYVAFIHSFNMQNSRSTFIFILFSILHQWLKWFWSKYKVVKLDAKNVQSVFCINLILQIVSVYTQYFEKCEQSFGEYLRFFSNNTDQSSFP